MLGTIQGFLMSRISQDENCFLLIAFLGRNNSLSCIILHVGTYLDMSDASGQYKCDQLLIAVYMDSLMMISIEWSEKTQKNALDV